MIYLLLSIACSTIIILLFKYFEQKKIHTFQAIVVNYLVCLLVGLPLTDFSALSGESGIPWAGHGIVLGVLFIALFYLIGITAQKVGVAVASVSMKLGVVFPIVIAISVYGEPLTVLKGIAIAIVILALFLASHRKNKGTERISPRLLLLPFIVFAGSGVCDAIVQHTENHYFSQGGSEAFLIILFGTAGGIGLLVAVGLSIAGKIKWSFRNVLAGTVLGIPNYGSVYFLYQALNHSGIQESHLYPANNISIVVCAAFFAWIIYKEKLSYVNMTGLALAVIAILLMMIDANHGHL